MGRNKLTLLKLKPMTNPHLIRKIEALKTILRKPIVTQALQTFNNYLASKITSTIPPVSRRERNVLITIHLIGSNKSLLILCTNNLVCRSNFAYETGITLAQKLIG